MKTEQISEAVKDFNRHCKAISYEIRKDEVDFRAVIKLEDPEDVVLWDETLKGDAVGSLNFVLVSNLVGDWITDSFGEFYDYSVDTSDFSATYNADKNQYYFDGEIIVEFTVRGD